MGLSNSEVEDAIQYGISLKLFCPQPVVDPPSTNNDQDLLLDNSWDLPNNNTDDSFVSSQIDVSTIDEDQHKKDEPEKSQTTENRAKAGTIESKSEPSTDLVIPSPQLKIAKPRERAKRKVHGYNLRVKKRGKAEKPVSIIEKPVLHKLQPINPNVYHPNRDEDADRLVDITKLVRASQIHAYESGESKFIVMSWLTTARVFQYNFESCRYDEVKRIPGRFIHIGPNIITSLHFREGKFYLAYLWSHDDVRPFIEVRDIDGKLLHNRFYYDEGYSIQLIYSDQDYIYIKTTNGLIDIHRKDFFGVIHYRVDFRVITDWNIKNTWVDKPSFKSYTKMPLVSASQKNILVSRFDVMDHKVTHCYNFDKLPNDEYYHIVSMHKKKQCYIIHRNPDSKAKISGDKRSRLDFGYTAKIPSHSQYFFMHESTISFRYDIQQLEVDREYLYIFGHTKLPNGLIRYETGCMYIPSLRPLWAFSLNDVDENCIILPHTNHIALIKSCQRLQSIKTDTEKFNCDDCKVEYLSKDDLNSHKRYGHHGILSAIDIHRNKTLLDWGSTVLKKINLTDS